MRYKFTEIETFLAVVELGTFTQAAARLELAKSVVTKRVSNLEGALGKELFRREGGRITPTPEAERLAKSVRPAMKMLAATLQAVARTKVSALGLRGALRISAPISLTSIHLDMWAAAFAELHPELELTIDYEESYRNILHDGFDVGIVLGEVRDTRLMRRTILQDWMVACASTSYLEKRGVPLHPLDLSEHECIGYRHLANEQVWQFTASGETFTPVTRTRLNSNNAIAIRNFAQAGSGVAMLPGLIAKPAIASQKLVSLFAGWETRAVPITVVWRSAQPERAELLAFVDFLEEMLASEAFWLRGAL